MSAVRGCIIAGVILLSWPLLAEAQASPSPCSMPGEGFWLPRAPRPGEVLAVQYSYYRCDSDARVVSQTTVEIGERVHYWTGPEPMAMLVSRAGGSLALVVAQGSARAPMEWCAVDDHIVPGASISVVLGADSAVVYWRAGSDLAVVAACTPQRDFRFFSAQAISVAPDARHFLLYSPPTAPTASRIQARLVRATDGAECWEAVETETVIGVEWQSRVIRVTFANHRLVEVSREEEGASPRRP